MTKKTFAALSEEARESLLNVVADAVSELHRSKRKLDEGDDDDGSTYEESSGDFLYDFTRLNLQYLNQLAGLGSSYSALGARVLDKLHGYFSERPEHEEAAELTVTDREQTRVTLRLQNPFDKRASVEIAEPIPKRSGAASSEKLPRLSVPEDQGERFVGGGKTLQFEVAAAAAESRVGKTYRFELPVRFRAGSRTIEERLTLSVRRVRS